MKLGREVSRHNELDNWRNTHRFESVMATKWLLLTISETEPGLWDRLIDDVNIGPFFSCSIFGSGYIEHHEPPTLSHAVISSYLCPDAINRASSVLVLIVLQTVDRKPLPVRILDESPDRGYI